MLAAPIKIISDSLLSQWTPTTSVPDLEYPAAAIVTHRRQEGSAVLPRRRALGNGGNGHCLPISRLCVWDAMMWD